MRRTLPLILAALLLLATTSCEDRRDATTKAADWWPRSEQAMARCVIRHESSGNPYAVSPSNDHGILQVNAVHRRAFEALTGKPFFPNIYNPVLAGQYGRQLWDQQGWRPWVGARYC